MWETVSHGGTEGGATFPIFSTKLQDWESLKKELTAACGEPVIETGEEGLWTYAMFTKDGAEIALSSCERRNGKREIHLTARHQVLAELFFRVLDELDNQMFAMPLPAPGGKPAVQNKRTTTIGGYQLGREEPRVRINTNPELFP